MSIPPISQVPLAAAVAGSDRAASAANSSAQAAGTAPGGDAAAAALERVSKADLSGDSDADGRQLLDSFESSERDPPDDQPAEQSVPQEEGQPNERQSEPGGHIDLIG